MNKITDKARKEALRWFDEQMFKPLKANIGDNPEDRHAWWVCGIIRAALEQPSLEMTVGSVYAYACVCMDKGIDIRQVEVPIILHSVRYDLGIEVTGDSPDNISKEVQHDS